MEESKPFIISNTKGSAGFVELEENEPNILSVIAEFEIPSALELHFEKDDPYQEVIFTPYNDNGVADENFIIGELLIKLESETGKRTWILYKKSTKFMNPSDTNKLIQVSNIVSNIMKKQKFLKGFLLP